MERRRIDLAPDKLVATGRRLCSRIRERFPQSGLIPIAETVAAAAEESVGGSRSIAAPNRFVRTGVWILVLALPVAFAFTAVPGFDMRIAPRDAKEFLELAEAGLGLLVYLGAGVLFLFTIESRLQRRRAHRILHELRVLAHLVDMHQLDKDPVFLHAGATTTASSPKRTFTAFELGRYLDYCTELLSLVGKIAAVYGQHLPDPVIQDAVDQIEALTTGLSTKIWQKIMTIGDEAVSQSP